LASGIVPSSYAQGPSEYGRTTSVKACAAGSGADFVNARLKWLGDFDVLGNGGSGRGSVSALSKGLSGDANYRRPQIAATLAITADPYGADVAAAFNLSNPFFKRQLCSLDYVFIDSHPRYKDTSQAWGFWETQGQFAAAGQGPGRPLTFVGLPTRLWSKDLSLAQTEKLRLEQLLGVSENWSDRVKFSASDNSRAVALIGVLAHELGHIRWRNGEAVDTLNCDPRFVSGPGDPARRGRSWANAPIRHPADQRFRYFGVPFPPGTDPNGAARRTIDIGKKAEAEAMLWDIHQSGRWASLFATVAPDEDFAETYKMMALRGVANLSFELRGNPGGVVSLSEHLEDRTTTLRAKAVCIAQYLKDSS
jgi:hypothetical protein